MNKTIDNTKTVRRSWFYIDTYVYIAIKKENLLLYNSLTGKTLEYTNEPKILDLIRKMKSKKNLQVIGITDQELEDRVIGNFVAEIRGNFMGDLIDASLSQGKPVQMMPRVKVRKDVNILKKGGRSIGEDMMSYLTELFLYIYPGCGLNCGMCASAYKQFPCCTKEKPGEVSTGNIEAMFKEVAGSALVRLNILGGDIFSYPRFGELSQVLNQTTLPKVYYTHYQNVAANSDKMKILSSSSAWFKILIPFPLDSKGLKTALEVINLSSAQASFVFIVEDEVQYNEAESLIAGFEIEVYEFAPYYNGKNREFFQENVFVSKEEIIAGRPSLAKIYTNSLVNEINHGRLVIFSNSAIHANANFPRLGTLGKDSLYDVVYKELYQGKSWRRVREHIKPCNQCTLAALCPPLNNYTYAMDRNNLCHVRE